MPRPFLLEGPLFLEMERVGRLQVFLFFRFDHLQPVVYYHILLKIPEIISERGWFHGTHSFELDQYFLLFLPLNLLVRAELDCAV